MPDSLLRVLTCGSVDDGKSTLIGRLLFECGTIPDDVMAALERDSKRFGTVGGGIDYALLVDGLEAEREQGMTIDVAYRFFETPRAPLHPGRHAGPPAVHAQHGHRRLDRRPGRAAGRRAQGRADADPPACRHRRRSWASGTWCWRSTRWTWSALIEAVSPRSAHDFRALWRSLSSLRSQPIPICARDGDNVTRPERADAVVRGPVAAARAGDAPIRVDAAEAAVPHAGAVGEPARPWTSAATPAPSPPGRVRPGDAVVNAPSGTEADGRAHRHHGRRPGRGRRRATGHPGAGPGDRRLARRRAGGRIRRRPPADRFESWVSGWTRRRCSAAAPIC